MKIDDKLTDIELMLTSLEQQDKTDTQEYKDLQRYRQVLLDTINAR